MVKNKRYSIYRELFTKKEKLKHQTSLKVVEKVPDNSIREMKRGTMDSIRGIR